VADPGDVGDIEVPIPAVSPSSISMVTCSVVSSVIFPVTIDLKALARCNLTVILESAIDILF
jgi:hypothetical protein